jgi:carbonic anhydrase
MKFRKTALKARHKAQLDQEKQQIEKEIEQSVNELKLQLELNRLKAVEKQVGFVSCMYDLETWPKILFYFSFLFMQSWTT